MSVPAGSTPRERLEATLEFVDRETIETPRDGDVLTKRWWVYRPGKGLVFHRSPRGPKRPTLSGYPSWCGAIPQCNPHEAVARNLQAKLYPDDEIVFVEAAYIGREHPSVYAD